MRGAGSALRGAGDKRKRYEERWVTKRYEERWVTKRHEGRWVTKRHEGRWGYPQLYKARAVRSAGYQGAMRGAGYRSAMRGAVANHHSDRRRVGAELCCECPPRW